MLQNQNHIPRGRGRLVPNDFQRQTAIAYDVVRSMVANAELNGLYSTTSGFAFRPNFDIVGDDGR
jgi:hypothetical protein